MLSGAEGDSQQHFPDEAPETPEMRLPLFPLQRNKETVLDGVLRKSGLLETVSSCRSAEVASQKYIRLGDFPHNSGDKPHSER